MQEAADDASAMEVAPTPSMIPTRYSTEGTDAMQEELGKTVWREEDDEGELDELIAKPDRALDYIPAALAFAEDHSPFCTALRNGEERCERLCH